MNRNKTIILKILITLKGKKFLFRNFKIYKRVFIKIHALALLTLSRVTIVHHSDTWSLTKVKNFISDHVNQLNGILKNMPEGPEKAAYITLKKSFLIERDKLKEENKRERLIQINEIKKNIVYKALYKEIYPSVSIDACMSTFNNYLIENALKEKITNDPETLDITILFPKNSTVNVIKTSKVLKRLAGGYFSQDEQRTILANLDRFGIGNTVLAIEK